MFNRLLFQTSYSIPMFEQIPKCSLTFSQSQLHGRIKLLPNKSCGRIFCKQALSLEKKFQLTATICILSRKFISLGKTRRARVIFSPTPITRHNSADSVPTSHLVCIKEIAIRTTFYCWNNLLHLQLIY